MARDYDSEEEKRLKIYLAIINENSRIKLAGLARLNRLLYDNLRRCIRAIPDTCSKGGHKKRLTDIQDTALKRYIVYLICTG